MMELPTPPYGRFCVPSWAVVRTLTFVATVSLLAYAIHETDRGDPLRRHFYHLAAFYGAYSGVFAVCEHGGMAAPLCLHAQLPLPTEWLAGLVAGGLGLPLGLGLLVEYLDHPDPDHMYLILACLVPFFGFYFAMIFFLSTRLGDGKLEDGDVEGDDTVEEEDNVDDLYSYEDEDHDHNNRIDFWVNDDNHHEAV